MPIETAPDEAVPSETVTSETVTSETVTSETVTSETVTSETAPKEVVPKEAAPKEAVPNQTGPGENGSSDRAPIRFDTKISVLLRDDLQPWQRLNVCAFLVSGIAGANPELIGEPYQDADGTDYLAMFRQPVLILAGSKELLTLAHSRALTRGLPVSIFTSDLFATGNDRDNRATVRAVRKDQLDLVGMAVHGPRNAVDKVFKGAQMHS